MQSKKEKMKTYLLPDSGYLSLLSSGMDEAM